MQRQLADSVGLDLAKRFTKKRWRRPQRMTLPDAHNVVRRKDLVMPVFMELDTSIVRRKSRATVRKIKIAFIVALSAQALVVWLLLSLPLTLAIVVAPAVIYWLGARTAHRSWVLRLFEATPTEDVTATRLTKTLSARAELKSPPQIAVINDPRVDSISFPSTIIITAGVLELESLEMEAVLAREVTRIRDGEAEVNLAWMICSNTAEFASRPGTIFAIPGFLLGPAALMLWPLRHELLPKPPRTEIASALLTSYPPALQRALAVAQPGFGVRNTSKALWLSGAKLKGAKALSEM